PRLPRGVTATGAGRRPARGTRRRRSPPGGRPHEDPRGGPGVWLLLDERGGAVAPRRLCPAARHGLPAIRGRTDGAEGADRGPRARSARGRVRHESPAARAAPGPPAAPPRAAADRP